MKVFFVKEQDRKKFMGNNKDHIFRAVHFSQSLNNSESLLNASIVPLSKASYEIWLNEEPVTIKDIENTRVTQTKNLWYTQFEPYNSSDQNLEKTAYELYQRIFLFADKNGLQLVRIWNYVPNILDKTGNLERYRQFNMGRNNAWIDFGPKDSNGNPVVPAASGIGALGGALKIEVIFSSEKPIHIQNTRQINSFDYSNKYGPKPPMFSRATYLENTGLFISGTASIVNEDSVHPGNPILQTKETMKNIAHLISQENLSVYGIKDKNYYLEDIKNWRIYIKNAHQAPLIDRTFREIINSAQASYVLLHDDICRDNLLVEIEGAIFS